jgi:uncharacterized protein (DUF433 family)
MTHPIAALEVPISQDEQGVVRVGGTRVTLITVLELYKNGYSPEKLAASFDTLRLADIYSVIGYYLHHQAELDAWLEDEEHLADAVRRDMDENLSPDEILRRMAERRRQVKSFAER